MGRLREPDFGFDQPLLVEGKNRNGREDLLIVKTSPENGRACKVGAGPSPLQRLRNCGPARLRRFPALFKMGMGKSFPNADKRNRLCPPLKPTANPSAICSGPAPFAWDS